MNRPNNIVFFIALFTILPILISLISLNSRKLAQYEGGTEYKRYNNYLIFKQSYEHLVQGKDLYIEYPDEHFDLYKYTPTFSALFGLFYFLPDWLGLISWNSLNALVLMFSVFYLPKLEFRQKAVILLILLVEMVTSIQNHQSNSLLAGLIIFAFGLMERKKIGLAILLIIFSAFIKLFGIVALALLIFYPNKLKSAFYALFWLILLMLFPLLFITMDQYFVLIESYGRLLANDHDSSFGFSIMGIANSWFGLNFDKNLVVLGGGILLLLPILKVDSHKSIEFRYMFLVSILIWLVIFNHKAESPTFIIAMAGAAIWFTQNRKSWFAIFALIFAFLLTSLSPTDIFPEYLRETYVKPYSLKALPMVIIWIAIIYQMINHSTDGRYDRFNWLKDKLVLPLRWLGIKQ